jgi:hypothetical protein
MKNVYALRRRLINLIVFLTILGTMGLMVSLSGTTLQTQVKLLQTGNRQVQAIDSNS